MNGKRPSRRAFLLGSGGLLGLALGFRSRLAWSAPCWDWGSTDFRVDGRIAGIANVVKLRFQSHLEDMLLIKSTGQSALLQAYPVSLAPFSGPRSTAALSISRHKEDFLDRQDFLERAWDGLGNVMPDTRGLHICGKTSMQYVDEISSLRREVGRSGRADRMETRWGPVAWVYVENAMGGRRVIHQLMVEEELLAPDRSSVVMRSDRVFQGGLEEWFEYYAGESLLYKRSVVAFGRIVRPGEALDADLLPIADDG